MTQFTNEQLNQIIGFCHIATQAKGLEIAEPALNVAGKAERMIKEINESETKEDGNNNTES